MAPCRIPWTDLHRQALCEGRALVLDLPAPWPLPPWGVLQSVLCVEEEGQLRVYANLCRHQPVPLDVGAPAGTNSVPCLRDAPAPPGKREFLCLRHGARYRFLDGGYVTGPGPRGVGLLRMAVTVGDELVVHGVLPDEG